MVNREICEYIKKLDSKKNNFGKKYISDLCVKQGYGQSYGGYLTNCKKNNLEVTDISQKEHFLGYYDDNNKAEKLPAYSYLRCPQLLLFIAEIAGVPSENLDEAYKKVKDYENAKNLRNTNKKNGNYMWGQQEFRDFKSTLKISQVVKIIRNAKDWDDVIKEVRGTI